MFYAGGNKWGGNTWGKMMVYFTCEAFNRGNRKWSPHVPCFLGIKMSMAALGIRIHRHHRSSSTMRFQGAKTWCMSNWTIFLKGYLKGKCHNQPVFFCFFFHGPPKVEVSSLVVDLKFPCQVLSVWKRLPGLLPWILHWAQIIKGSAFGSWVLRPQIRGMMIRLPLGKLIPIGSMYGILPTFAIKINQM